MALSLCDSGAAKFGRMHLLLWPVVGCNTPPPVGALRGTPRARNAQSLSLQQRTSDGRAPPPCRLTGIAIARRIDGARRNRCAVGATIAHSLSARRAQYRLETP